MFKANVTPTETPFMSVRWNFGDSFKLIISSRPEVNSTTPDYEGRITLFSLTGSLELRNLTLRDSGVYRVEILSEDSQKTGETSLYIYGEQSLIPYTIFES